MKSRLLDWMKPCGQDRQKALFRIIWRAKARGGARSVEIARPEKRSSSPRDLLISLRTAFADFATAFTEVIDFVPYEDSETIGTRSLQNLPRGWF